MGSFKGRDPKSTGPCVTAARKPAETTPLPSTAQLGAPTQAGPEYLVGRAGPSISGHCFCRRAARLPPRLTTQSPGSTRASSLGWSRAPRKQLSSPGSRVQHAPALAGRSEGAASGLAKQKGRRRKGGKEAGGSGASPFREEELRAGRLLLSHLLSYSLQPSLQLEAISHRHQAFQGL